jgi:hypothetical protein
VPLPQIGKSFLCFHKREYLVDHRLDLFRLNEFADLGELIAIRTDKKK